jgi:hypothetical protein
MVNEFRNIKGFAAEQLDIGDDETPDSAIQRHRDNGYIIIGYRISEDVNGHPVLVPDVAKPSDTPEESEDNVNDDET